MKIIGIFGRSGSGKTTLSKTLEKCLNAKHIDIDKISHRVLNSKKMKNFVKINFGESVFDGTIINRKRLGEIVFNDSQKLKLLNSTAQTEIERIIDKKITTYSDFDYIILDYALLPFMKYFSRLDISILVKASKTARFERLAKRDNISFEYFEARENSLKNYSNKNFEFIINNQDSKAEFQKKSLEIAKKIKSGENKNA